MKSLAQLAEIKEKMKENETMRHDGERAKKIVVGMGTCGIAAGARGIVSALTEEIAKRNLEHVTIAQTGCIGMCKLEPMMDVVAPGEEKVTYVHLTPDQIPKIVGEHIVNGRPVKEFTIGAYEKE